MEEHFPHHTHEGVEIEILPYERISHVLRQAATLTLFHCPCRQAARNCDSPTEACIGLFPPPAPGEELLVITGEIGRALSVEQALAVVKMADDAGLVHTFENAKEGPSFLCNCCSCCCVLLRGHTELGLRAPIAHSNFIAHVDEALCNGCEDCLPRCRFSALRIDRQTAVVDRTRCLGCGLCVSKCATEAIALERRAETLEPAANPIELYMRWFVEKGRMPPAPR